MLIIKVKINEIWDRKRTKIMKVDSLTSLKLESL
jgi:hypothetical protein